MIRAVRLGVRRPGWPWRRQYRRDRRSFRKRCPDPTFRSGSGGGL